MGARNRACVAENGRSIGQGEMDRWAQTSTGATCTMTLPGMPLPMLFLVEMSEAVEGKETASLRRACLEVGKQMSVTVRTRQNVIYCVRRSLHARVISCLTICLRLFWILIELACITNAGSDWRHVGCINILLLQPVPGDLCKPGVVHDIFAASVKIAQSFGQVWCDELLQQVMCVGMDVRRVFYSRLENVFVDFHGRAAVPEGRETAEHFEDEDAKRPPDTVSTCIPGQLKPELTNRRIYCSPLMLRPLELGNQEFRRGSM